MKTQILFLIALLPFFGWSQSLISTGDDTVYVLPGTVVSSVSGAALNGSGDNYYSLPYGTDLYDVSPSSKRILMGNPQAAYEVRNVGSTAIANFYMDVNYLAQTPVADLSVQNANSTGDYKVNLGQVSHAGYNDIPVEWTITRSGSNVLDMHNLIFKWGNELETSQIPVKRLYIYDNVSATWMQLPTGSTMVDEINNTLVYSGYQGDLNGTKFMIAQADPVIDLSGDLDTLNWCAGYTSDIQSFLLEANNIIDDVKVYAPSNFEISLIPQGPFSDSLVLSPVANNVGPIVIYIRIADDATSAGTFDIVAYYEDVFYSVITDSLEIVSTNDTELPTITAPSDVTVAGDSNCEATGIALGTPVTGDNCELASVVNDAPAIFPLGSTTVTWTATDAAGNAATATQIVTVVDSTSPVISGVPANITVSNDPGSCDAVVSWGQTVLDLNQSAFNIGTTGNDQWQSFTAGESGLLTQVEVFTNGCSTRSFTMEIYDGNGTSGSLLYSTFINLGSVCSGWQQFNIPTSAGVNVQNGNVYTVRFLNSINGLVANTSYNYGNYYSSSYGLNPGWQLVMRTSVSQNVIVTDNCSGITLTSTHNPGDVFPLGTTTVTYTATDAAGNVTTASFTVTVEDTENPTITAPSDVTVSANSSCNAFGVALGTATTGDNCGVASVTNDAPGTYPLGTTVVTWTVTDNAGNTASATQNVTVEDNTNPTIVAPADITVNADNNCEAVISNLGNPIASDNCTTVTVTNDGLSAFPLGATVVTWTATDAAGNTATATQTITVVDNTDPVIAAMPSNMTVGNDLGTCDAAVTWTVPAASDNCTSVTLTSTHNSGDVFGLGTTTVTYTATDAAGNVTTASFTVTVEDTENPTITAPSDVTVSANSSCNAFGVALGTATTGDNCGVASVTNDAPGTYPLGTTVVTWTVTDNAGNTASATQNVTVEDNTNPTIVAPADITVNADNNCEAVISNLGNPIASDNCTTVTVTNDGLSAFPLGATVVTWTATDAAGNTATATQTITVVDNTDPVIAAMPSNMTVGNDAGTCDAAVTWTAPAASDNCTAVTLTSTHNSGDVFGLGTTTVTYTATDAAGNVATASFTVTVEDTENPTITAPSDVTVSANSSCNAFGVALGMATTGDNCGVASVTNDAPGTYPLGTTVVTWTVTDNAGNTAIATQNVTVEDNTNPTIVAPADITVNADNNCEAVVSNLGNPIASDNCTTVTVTNDGLSAFPLGATVVTWTATDAAGNTAIATQTITVVDNTNPVIAAMPSNMTVGNDAGTCDAAVTWTAPIASDNCTSVTLTSTHNSGDVFGLGTTTVTYTATDAAGNVTTASFTVTVEDTENPTITAPSDVTVSANSSCNAFGVALGTATTGDNCGVASVTNDASGTYPLGTTVVTWTVTDNAGNTATATQNVTVEDNTNPTIVAPADITVNADNNCEAVISNLGNPIASDNCTTVTVTNDGLSAFPLGATVVTWTATDAAGNTATATQTITVVDNTDPVIAAMPSDMTVGNDAGTCDAVVTWTAPTASDNCTAVTLTSIHNSGDVFPLGTTTVTYTATDAAGNVATASFTVTVEDTENPTITAPLDVTVSANNSCNAFGVALGTATTGDNCGVSSVTNDAPGTYPLGTTVVTWTVTDNAGNTASATQNVTVEDNTNPTIVAPADITVSANASCGAVISNLGNTVTFDNCGVASVSNNAPSVFPLGATIVTWTVTDNSGNASTANQLITVVDNTNPTITEPVDIIVSADMNCEATGVALGAPATADNCGVATVVNNAPAAFPIGTTVVTWTVTDNSGNIATATQEVLVIDDMAPVVTAPADVTVSTNFGCEAIGVVLGSPVVTDNCTAGTITNDAPMIYPLGTTIVTWTATDAAGNSTSVTQQVIVEDTQAPVLTVPSDLEVISNSGCDATGVVLGTPVTDDNCGIASVVNDAPVVFPSGTTVVTWTVTDNSGNQTTGSQLVTVLDLVAPTAVLTDITIKLPVGTDAVIDETMIDSGSSDNCSAISFQLSQYNFTCDDLGENLVTVTITDQAGNETVATVVVTVEPSGVDQDFDGIDDACDEDIKDYVDVPNGFTPDGDGINDTFVIPGLDGEAQITIYNRYGNMVYQNTAYDNSWDGTSSLNGQELPDGTYFYVLELSTETKSGYVYINRVH